MAWEWLSPVTTGAVGLAGIFGSVWTAASARRSQERVLGHQLDSEARRQLRMDKQALYIKTLDVFTSAVELSIRRTSLEGEAEQSSEKRTEILELQDKQLSHFMAIGRFRSEIALLAGSAMSAEYSKAVDAIGEFTRQGQKGDVKQVTLALAGLTIAMHKDLRHGLAS
ncbi:hypothetical protein [Micromonospora deserti]|uniref:Uncharacterized protein n=1 Tax=Micromonospora deserti TaxID=2070366 RepID=A0A2W2CG61_9ACTN|nr:hypothetical protein [Micromonospora deserti]PZF98405.1 hypothetical protein C1I99_13430 [Micromonospora deserti]